MAKAEDASAVRLRLQKFNPFVVGLQDRPGLKADSLELYDGRDRLVRHPIAEFDGRPLRKGRRYFIPAIVLVVAAVVSPLLPFYVEIDFQKLALCLAAFLVLAGLLAVSVAYNLNNVRKDYYAAGRELMVTDFLVKAQGAQKMIYLFKIVVRWRRFLRYTLNVGGVSSILVFALAMFGHSVRHTLGTEQFLFSVIFFLSALGFIALFEIARLVFTTGMDPTLALVLMIEDIGAQLLAARRPANVIQTNDG